MSAFGAFDTSIEVMRVTVADNAARREGMRLDLLAMAERANFDTRSGNRVDLLRREHWRECQKFAAELGERRT